MASGGPRVQIADGVVRPVPWEGDNHHKVKRMEEMLLKHQEAARVFDTDGYVSACPECHSKKPRIFGHTEGCAWAELAGKRAKVSKPPPKPVPVDWWEKFP